MSDELTCDVCGEPTDLREPVDFNGAHLLVCQWCAEDIRESESADGVGGSQ